MKRTVLHAGLASLLVLGGTVASVTNDRPALSDGGVRPATASALVRPAADPEAAEDRTELRSLRASRSRQPAGHPTATKSAAPSPASSPKRRPAQLVAPHAGSTSVTPKVSSHYSTSSLKGYAESLVGAEQFSCLEPLWQHESEWKINADNGGSAYGIPQALPGSKMASEGADWRTNGKTQIRWGVKYIAGRYRNACNAYAHWRSHNWY